MGNQLSVLLLLENLLRGRRLRLSRGALNVDSLKLWCGERPALQVLQLQGQWVLRVQLFYPLLAKKTILCLSLEPMSLLPDLRLQLDRQRVVGVTRGYRRLVGVVLLLLGLRLRRVVRCHIQQADCLMR